MAPGVLSILEAVPEEGHCSIEALLQGLLASCARQLSTNTSDASSLGGRDSDEYGDDDGSYQDDDASDADIYDYQDDDEDFGIVPGTVKPGVNMSVLRR